MGSLSSDLRASAALVVSPPTAGALPHVSSNPTSTSQNRIEKLNDPIACHSPGPSSDMETETAHRVAPKALSETEKPRLTMKCRWGAR